MEWNSDTTIVVVLLIIALVIVIVSLALTPYKIKLRKRRADRITQCLSPENISKITDKEDLRLLQAYEEKAVSYSKNWWFNNTPTHFYRNSKVNKMIDKYNLNVN